MRSVILTCTLVVMSVFAAAVSANAKGLAPVDRSEGQRSLSAFEGRYEYQDGGIIFLVSDGARLVALLGDAKYPLRRRSADLFTNGAGVSIPFVRDAKGKVTAFSEGGRTYRKLSDAIPSQTRRLLHARAPGARPWRYARPVELTDGIATGGAARAGLSSALLHRLVGGIDNGSYPEIHSVLLYRRGALVLEEYFYGFDRDRPHPMRSLTKSVIALAAGAAIDQKLLLPDEPVLGRLQPTPPEPRKGRITLTNLLSHKSGLACDDNDEASPGNEVKIYESDDWVRAFWGLPSVADPGGTAKYCSAGILVAGRAVEKAAGMPLPSYAQQQLFAPLGIHRSAWRWNFDLNRSQRGEFAQIYMRPRDMLKLGLLVAQNGRWRGQQLISADWVGRMTAKQSVVDGSAYGLGIWHRFYDVSEGARSTRVETLMMSGNGGQKVYVVPALDIVAVFTGGNYNEEAAANRIMADLLLPALLRVSNAERVRAN